MSPYWRGFRRGLAMPAGWLLTWTLYWAGDGIARVVERWPESWERSGEWLADVYQRVMGASLAVNDACGLRVWR